MQATERSLHRLMWRARVVQALRVSWGAVFLPVPVLALVLGQWVLYVGAAYTGCILVLGRRVVPRLGRRIRDVALELYGEGSISVGRFNEAAVLVNSMLCQGPPQPGDRIPMPLRPT